MVKPLEKHETTLMGRLRGYFFAGVLVTAPVALTMYFVWLVVRFADNFVKAIIPEQYLLGHYLPFDIPGVGLIITVLGLTLIGALAAGFFGRLIIRIGERIVEKMPIVRNIYGAFKQVFETVLSRDSMSFRQVALVEYPRRGVWSLGFVTGTTTGEVQKDTEDEVINVFIPTTPNPTSGFLLFIPRSEVQILEMTVEDGIKMVVSAGIITPKQKVVVDRQK